MVRMFRKVAATLAALTLTAQPCLTAAQVRTVDPNAAFSAPPEASSDPVVTPLPLAQDSTPELVFSTNTTLASTPSGTDGTYRKDDLIGAATGVFGKGSKGLAEILEKILKDQGQPNAYIAGREASAAIALGFRYGSGTMTHKVEGRRPVYWTGPSLGFDLGGDAANVFVLVYNLYDSQDLYRRYPQVEGRAYFVGGFAATYLRRGQIVLIPIRLGMGARLGANVGYMKFSLKSRWLPF
jgi:hypothetical protein